VPQRVLEEKLREEPRRQGRGFLFPYIRRSLASEEENNGAQHQQPSIQSREFISDLAAQ